jgi:lysozyme family protein
MLTAGSSAFRQYVTFLLRWEGKTSKDPQDSASSCAPFAGAYHTNKGVTYCTFKEIAAALGVVPVTYERFLALSDSDVSKFVYEYYRSVRGQDLPDIMAISLTEVAWGSGSVRAIKTLQGALNRLGNTLTVDGVLGSQTLAAVKRANVNKLYDEFWKVRKEWLLELTKNPDYDQYRTNWITRVADFMKHFPPTQSAALVIVAALLLLWVSKK